MRIAIAIGIVILGVVLVRMCVFTVDRTEFVYRTQFGRHVATYDGASGDAGLHCKWPWPVESVQRLDRRLQYFDLPGAELMTRDPKRNTIDKTLTLDAYVCWRIPDADHVDQFIRSVGTPEGAQAIIGQRLNSELGAAVGKLELDDLIGIEPGKDDADGQHRRRVDEKRDELRKKLLKEMTGGEYGIEIVDIRLRRLNHPPAVRQAIFDRIVSEREKKANDYLSQGQQEAANIKSKSVYEVAKMNTEAEVEKIKLQGQADAAADRIRSDAQMKDPQFYAFLKKLEEYQHILGDNKSVLLLSTHRELFDTLFQPPTPGGAPTSGRDVAEEEGQVTMRKRTRLILLTLLVLAVVAYGLTGVVQVRPGERAVVRRFGRVLDDKPKPGLWVGLPWGMDRVDRVAVDHVQNVAVGYTEDAGDGNIMPAGQLLTGDHNLVNVRATIYYKVRPDEVDTYVAQADRADGLVARAVETVMAEWVAGRTVDDVLLNGKNEMGPDLVKQTQERVDAYDLGVQVLEARVTLIAAPDEVKSAFDNVAKAQTAISTLLNKAEQERDSALRTAEGDKFRKEKETEAYVLNRTTLAKGEADRFLTRLQQYEEGKKRNPNYLRQIWEEQRSKLFATLKANGQIGLLDHHLGADGLDLTISPLPKKP